MYIYGSALEPDPRIRLAAAGSSSMIPPAARASPGSPRTIPNTRVNTNTTKRALLPAREPYHAAALSWQSPHRRTREHPLR